MFTTITGFGIITETATGKTFKFEFSPDTTHDDSNGFSYADMTDRQAFEDYNTGTVAELIASCIKAVKGIASNKLLTTEYMVTRHKEQIDAGIATSLTSAEYLILLNTRQQIRGASNAIEAEVSALPDAASVEAFDIAGHASWPA